MRRKAFDLCGLVFELTTSRQVEVQADEGFNFMVGINRIGIKTGDFPRVSVFLRFGLQGRAAGFFAFWDRAVDTGFRAIVKDLVTKAADDL